MRIPTAITTFIMCAAGLPAAAQTGLAGCIDSVLAAREAKAMARYDTAYIGRPGSKWTVKLRLNASGTDLNSRGNIDGAAFNTKLKAEPKNTIGGAVSYRGLSLGFAINPAKLAGRNKDNEFTLSTYGNRMGADLVYTSSKTFSGTLENAGKTYDIEAGKVSMDVLQVNAYYAFSHRRFSFPAAFSQSQVQKRSHGSWLLGMSAFAGRIRTDAEIMPGTPGTRLSAISVGVGGGYAYNFVIKSKWLLHISAVPHIVVYSRNRLKVDDVRQRAPFKFPSLINVGRMAVVRNFKNSFLGASAVVNLWQQGDADRMMIECIKWRARLFYGIRF